MKARRKLYTDEERDDAVCRLVKGDQIAAVSRETRIPATTLGRYVKQRRAGQPAHGQRCGTKPTLPLQAENDIVSWITGMQRSGAPVGRVAIVQKANDTHHRLHSSMRDVRDLTHGWYRRFQSHHPQLVARVAQNVSRTRNFVDVRNLRTLFHTLATLTIEYRLQPSQVFYMDETRFTSRANTKKVVSVKDSPNVYTNSSEISFHLLFVAAVAAYGFAVPSLFIVLGV